VRRPAECGRVASLASVCPQTRTSVDLATGRRGRPRVRGPDTPPCVAASRKNVELEPSLADVRAPIPKEQKGAAGGNLCSRPTNGPPTGKWLCFKSHETPPWDLGIWKPRDDGSVSLFFSFSSFSVFTPFCGVSSRRSERPDASERERPRRKRLGAPGGI
jgi:hypothetical protein